MGVFYGEYKPTISAAHAHGGPSGVYIAKKRNRVQYWTMAFAELWSIWKKRLGLSPRILKWLISLRFLSLLGLSSTRGSLTPLSEDTSQTSTDVDEASSNSSYGDNSYFNPRLDPRNYLEGPLSANPATRLRQLLARPGIVVRRSIYTPRDLLLIQKFF